MIIILHDTRSKELGTAALPKQMCLEKSDKAFIVATGTRKSDS